jgi:hypothetical protein
MLKFRPLQISGILLLICVAALFASDKRELGTWRLRSQKVIEGSSPISPFAPQTIMLIRQGKSGTVTLRFDPKLPDSPALQGQAMRDTSFSADGKTMTETVLGTEPSRYRIVNIWDKQ